MFLESSTWNQPLHKDPTKRKSSSETQGQLIGVEEKNDPTKDLMKVYKDAVWERTISYHS